MSIRDKARANCHTAMKGNQVVCSTTVHLDEADFAEAKNSGHDEEDYILHETAAGCALGCDCGGFPATAKRLNANTSYAVCEQDPSQLKEPLATARRS